jgi:tRNA threonylcarbamoyladenosine modification (KEOPS) complex Cgi121 subunit
MNFTSPKTFPEFSGFHLALYPLTTPDSSTDELEQRRSKLTELMRTYPDNLTFINARYISSLFHIHLAVSRALLNMRTQTLKTNSFANEVVYHMYPTHSIKEAFEKYGLKNAD